MTAPYVGSRVDPPPSPFPLSQLGWGERVPPPRPALSVIVCTYNRASFLPGCIASIRAGGMSDLEIVIVDDGSTDNTRDVVADLNGPDIRYIYQTNRGLSTARNTGIKISEGRYICYLDSDDFWLPSGPGQKMIDFLDAHADVGIAFAEANVGSPTKGYWSWIEWAGRKEFHALPGKTYDNFRVLDPIAFYRHLMLRNAVFTGAVIQRRELVVDAGMFDARLNAAGDWELYLRLAAKNTFAFCPEPFAIYSQHDSQMTMDLDKMIREFVDTRRRHLEHGLADEPAKRLLKRFHKNESFFYAYLAYERGEYGTARRRFGASLLENGFDARTAAYWLMTCLPDRARQVLRNVNRSIKRG
jgi:glycosyltransferase involved in cell wall biosynthesis